MEIKDLTDFDHLSLNSLLGIEPPVMFAGSGISLWSPCNLPTGRQFTNAIYSLLFQDLNTLPNHRKDLFLEYYNKLPFEVINERCPEPNKVNGLLKTLYNVYTPNPIHELLANNLFYKSIQSIITSNYDCCLDSAIANIYGVPIGYTMGNIRRIVYKNNSIGTNVFTDQIYFKIHGSTDTKYRKSLVFCLSQEGILPEWKRAIFRKMLYNKKLLIVGYSGSDFDICPEIALAQPKEIIWLFNEIDIDKIPPNVAFLSERCEIKIIKGDMIDFFSLLYSPISAMLSLNTRNLDSLLKSKFNERTNHLWRTRIYNCVNFNKLALIETKKIIDLNIESKTKIQFLSEHAGASASSGKYRDAAKSHDTAAEIARVKALPINIQITQILLACDAWRCYGSITHSVSRYLKAKTLITNMNCKPKDLLVDLDRNLILLLRHPYDFFVKIQLFFFSKKIQKIAASAISRSIEFYRKNGAWHQLQQLGLWREKFDLGNEVSLYMGHETPPSFLGYQQLNFPMGYMMAFRNNIKHAKRLLTDDEVIKIRDFIDIATELGINPEIWKFRLLIWRSAPKNQRKMKDFVEFIKVFFCCQYSILFRVWRIVIGD